MDRALGIAEGVTYVRPESGMSFGSAVPPRTWPTHYGPVSPRCPRTAINSQRSPPAATCEHEAWAALEPASSLGSDEGQGAKVQPSCATTDAVPAACPIGQHNRVIHGHSR